MNDVFSINRRVLQRIAYTMLAAFMVVATLPFLQPDKVAADQFTNRAIQMSDSSPSGNTSITSGVGSGENVTYRVSFDAVHAASSIVIDFCKQTPILNDACTAPDDMVIPATPTIAGQTGTVGTGSWTASSSNPGQIRLHNASPTDDIVGGGNPEVFDIEGITNPSTTGTFYARIYTFPDTTYGGYVEATDVNLDANSDFGGVALTTAAVITITARVQENLTFCITNAAPADWDDTANSGANANSCAADEVGANLPTVTLGHTVGGTTLVLDSGSVDIANGTYPESKPLYSQLSTNATHGAVINLRSNWDCAGLSANGGVDCDIPPVGPTPTILTPGTEAFGLFVADGVPNALTPAATGTIDATSTYNDGTNTNPATPSTVALGMDDQTTIAQVSGKAAYSGNVKASGVNGMFGSMLASSPGPTYRVENAYYFGATASLTTPAGIYTANLTITATGTF